MRFNKNKSIFAAALMACFAVFAVISPAHAQVSGWVATIMSSLAQIIIELVGKLLIVLIETLLAIVKYNDFIGSPAVERGWILVRDVSNMAFLIIFIAIAFATILGVEKYEWKRLLPKLLIMAVAINFSKTICGIIIDASQVVMITFVNGFKDVAAGNLIRGFGLNDMLSIRDLGADENVTDTAVAAASVLAVVLLLIAAITMAVIVLMFLVRIVMLWILIVLSPLAFMLSAAPGGEAQFQKWFQQFIKYAFIGPILAFFLWLSFSVMAGVSPGSNLAQDAGVFQAEGETGFGEVAGNTSAAISGISRSDQLLSYFIAIALLLLSLIVAQGIGVAGSNLAGSALNKIKSGGVKLGKLAALGVATGGVGSALGVIAGGKTAKYGYKGAKKGVKALGSVIGDVLDTAHGGKVTGLIGKIGKRLPLGKKLKGEFASLEDSGLTLGGFKKSWRDLRDKDREFKEAKGRGRREDIRNQAIYGLTTDREYGGINQFVNEAEKDEELVTADEDTMVERAMNVADNFQAAKDKGDATAIAKTAMHMLALEKLVTKNNAQNTMLGAYFNKGEVTDDVIAEMGNTQANPENLEHYFEEFYENDEDGKGPVKDAQDFMQNIDNARRQGNSEEEQRLINEFSEFAREKEGVADIGALQKRVGNRLYAKKYKVYDFNKKDQWLNKGIDEFNENDVLSGDVMQNGMGVDTRGGEAKSKGKHIGVADPLHWQALQKKLHDGLDQEMDHENLSLKFERDLGVEAIKAKNHAFGFLVTEKDGDQSRLNLANYRQEEQHGQQYGAKLQNSPTGDIAGLHPMSAHLQSFYKEVDESGNETGAGGMYYGENAPRHKDFELQSIAGTDARGVANQRIDNIWGYIGIDRKDMQYPLDEDKQKELAIGFYKRHNPVDGITDKLPENFYSIMLMKVLKTLGVKNVGSEQNALNYMSDIGYGTLPDNSPVAEGVQPIPQEEADKQIKVLEGDKEVAEIKLDRTANPKEGDEGGGINSPEYKQAKEELAKINADIEQVKQNIETPEQAKQREEQANAPQGQQQPQNQEIQDNIDLHEGLQNSIDNLSNAIDSISTQSGAGADMQDVFANANTSIENTMNEIMEKWDKLSDEQKDELGDIPDKLRQSQNNLTGLSSGQAMSDEELKENLERIQEQVREAGERTRNAVDQLRKSKK